MTYAIIVETSAKTAQKALNTVASAGYQLVAAVDKGTETWFIVVKP